MTSQERLDHYTKRREELRAEMESLDKQLHCLLLEQHEVGRQIFNAQFELRQGV